MDSFDQNSGYAEDSLTHDAAGNLTYDGIFAYSFDAWNRLVTVKKAYRDSAGNVQANLTVAELAYDGLGRRIEKTITNTGPADCAYHFYYDGYRIIETRNGSAQVPPK